MIETNEQIAERVAGERAAREASNADRAKEFERGRMGYLIQPSNQGDLIVDNPKRGRRYDKHEWCFRWPADEARWHAAGCPRIERIGAPQEIPYAA